jgi:hypothetical protein
MAEEVGETLRLSIIAKLLFEQVKEEYAAWAAKDTTDTLRRIAREPPPHNSSTIASAETPVASGSRICELNARITTFYPEDELAKLLGLES